MAWSFTSRAPVYMQIVSRIRADILGGVYQPDQQIPAVRQLALTAGVNPNTMQKALAELEDTRLIYTERTNGKFVTEDTALIEKYKIQYADALAERFLSGMKELGFSEAEAVKYLSK